MDGMLEHKNLKHIGQQPVDLRKALNGILPHVHMQMMMFLTKRWELNNL